MEMLGPNLQDLLTAAGGRFSLKTSVQLALQMLDLIQGVHHKGFIHRDIKPENFCMGTGAKKNQLHLIDFGLSKRFIDSDTNAHIKPNDDGGAIPLEVEDGKLNIGNAWFTTAWMQTGATQGSRRDDAMSLFYSVLYFATGTLPWILEATPEEEDQAAVLALKSLTVADVLCAKLPGHFATIADYLSQLKFPDKVDFRILKMSLGVVLNTGAYDDTIFDWRKLKDTAYLKRQAMHEGRLIAHDKGEASGFDLQTYYGEHAHYLGVETGPELAKMFRAQHRNWAGGPRAQEQMSVARPASEGSSDADSGGGGRPHRKSPRA